MGSAPSRTQQYSPLFFFLPRLYACLGGSTGDTTVPAYASSGPGSNLLRYTHSKYSITPAETPLCGQGTVSHLQKLFSVDRAGSEQGRHRSQQLPEKLSAFLSLSLHPRSYVTVPALGRRLAGTIGKFVHNPAPALRGGGSVCNSNSGTGHGSAYILFNIYYTGTHTKKTKKKEGQYPM